MNNVYNPLLARQLRKHLGEIDQIPEALLPFLNAVNASYEHYEEDRKLSDRAVEISSSELYAKNQQLRLKNEMLDSFVYRVSHDLKAPLNNISSLVMMLHELQTPAMASDKMISKVIHDIGETAQRMTERIADLLDISRVEGAANAHPEPVDIRSVLVKVMHDLESEIVKNDAEILTDFDAFDTVLGNQENMYSLLSNLLSNALKYRSPDRKPVVRLHTSTEAPYDVLSITDNGLGIDLERHGAKLFGMFNRFHSHVPGTGVGLYIIKSIIEKAGGKIAVDSTVGVGTTFKIYLKSTTFEKETQLHLARG